MILRDYQKACVDATFKYFEDGNTGNPLNALPTGTGKSLCIADFSKRACTLYPSTRIIIATHVKELIVQNLDTLIKIWRNAPAGVYSAGLNRKDVGCQITYASIQTICNVPELFPSIDLVLIDEAHLVPPRIGSSYGKFLAAMKEQNPACKVIGYTATPYRLGQGLLTDPGGIFTDMCFDITDRKSFNRLLDEGYLSNLVVKKPTHELDVSDVKIAGGEFVLSNLQKAVDQDSITNHAVDEILIQGADRKHWLIFGTGIDHCCHICDELTLRGISAAVVHSKMSDGQRDSVIADYKSGVYRCLVNNNILTTGFDMPGIDLIGCLRPTMSPNLWVQLLGRGTRPVYAAGYDLTTIQGRVAALAAGSKRDCLVLDFAGNTRRLGPINDPVIPIAKGQRKGSGQAPVKVCDACSTYNPASARYCSNCGQEFPKSTKLELIASSTEVIRRFDPPDIPIAPDTIAPKVDLITYASYKSKKKDSIACVRVEYSCGIRTFREFICFGHKGYALMQAKKWWRKRSTQEVPQTVEDALKLIESIDIPTHIKVLFGKGNPQVIDVDFSGTAFKNDEPINIPSP